ncbi:hypothetical protein [Comamonas terrigena]|uniref:hypothetical protein n=1 Tax=Comamonas terrigena TaxID=32013 RepID=UPI0028AB26A1|nr:hypothetical protein [Comamonas terrigena]
MQHEPTAAELYAPAGRMYARMEQADRQRYEAWLLAQGVHEVALNVAADRCSTEKAAAFFVDGFTGRDAAVSTPRAEGMEPVFREGRRAKGEKGMAQRCRTAAAALRSQDGYALEDWLQMAYQTRPVPWRMSFPG